MAAHLQLIKSMTIPKAANHHLLEVALVVVGVEGLEVAHLLGQLLRAVLVVLVPSTHRASLRVIA